MDTALSGDIKVIRLVIGLGCGQKH